MSRRHKNNHYHYAEQYTDRARMRRGRVLVLPKRFMFLAIMLVLIFAVITTTFSANFSTDTETSGGGAMIVKVRSAKAVQDLVSDGMDREEAIAMTGAMSDLASVGDFGSLLYNSNTAGWGGNSTIECNSDGWISLHFTAATNNESFKIYHKGWDDAYISKSAAAVSLNTEYTLNNTGSNPNMTFSFVQNAYYGMKIANPDVYNNMKMTLFRLFDANAVLYIDVSDYWNDDDPEIGGYFCDSTSNSATWVRATRCGDIGNTHLYKLVAPSTPIYSKLVLGRFQKGTTVDQMGFSGSSFFNQSVDIFYQASNTKIKLTSYGSGSATKATVSTSVVTHTHQYYAYEYTRNTVNDNYSLARTISSGTTPACETDTVSLSATDRSNSGYDFDGWYRGTSSGIANATTKVSDNLNYTPTNYAGISYYYAKYTLSTFTITYNSDASPATAAAGTISNPATNSVPAYETKVYGYNYTITSNRFTRTHYTQVGWATSPNYTSQTGASYYAFGAPYSSNAALTLYPVWELNTPTKSNSSALDPAIIASGSMTVGSTPVDLSLEKSDASQDADRTYSYTINGPTGHHASVGTDPSDSNNFMKFTADIPGSYTVKITITDVSDTNVINANNTASAETNTATISVAPDVPQFTITGYNLIQDEERDGSTSEKACKIIIGNRYYFSAEIDDDYLESHPTSSYTYTWSTNADFAAEHTVGTGASITFTNTIVPNSDPREYAINLITYDPENPPVTDPRTLANESHGLENVTLYCRATCNDVSKDSADKWLFYYVQPLIEFFKYDPMQKIFNMNDQTVSLAAEYNIENDPSYTTDLLFSRDNENYSSALEEPAHGFVASFYDAIKACLYPNGPKYFYLQMEGYNSQHELITSVSEKIHTTVGTADSTTSRPLYFDNATGVDLKNYLVMCYYIDGSGSLRYQTAQDLNKGVENDEGLHYRVMIPADATAVRFGFLGRDVDRVRYYGSPSIENGTITGFSVPKYYGYTDQMPLTASTRRIRATAASTVGSMQSFTCTAGVY